MIKFMLLAAPRSGTTWAANWLTTDTTLCLHDPLFHMHYTDIDSYPTKKMLGVSCTGLSYFSAWVNKHPARKVILHRDIKEVNSSLLDIGLPAIDASYMWQLDSIKGLHVNWMDLFNNPRMIYEYLIERPFDKERHKILCDIEMQPKFAGLEINHEVTKRLITEMRTAMIGV